MKKSMQNKCILYINLQTKCHAFMHKRLDEKISKILKNKD